MLAILLAAASSGCVASSRAISEDEAQIAGPRLLVIAPHPDDETLAVGGAIASARRHGWTVNVIVVTCGDAFGSDVRPRRGAKPMATRMRTIGMIRAEECRRATTALGVPGKDLAFLGFPDGSISDLLAANYDARKPARGTNGATRVPYRFAYRPQTPYAGSRLLSELEDLIRADHPTTVIYPDPADQHPDHWAVGVFSQMALAQSGYRGVAATYLVHLQGFPKPYGLRPSAPLVAPLSVDRTGTTWLEMPLATTSRNAKREALGDYHSQGGRLARSFLRTDELFGFSPVRSLGTGAIELAEPAPYAAESARSAAPYASQLDLRRANGGIVLGLRTVGRLSPRVAYTVHVRALGADGGMRLYDAEWNGKSLRTFDYSISSVVTDVVPARVGTDGLDVPLPVALTHDATWLALGADWRVGRGAVNVVPWRVVRVVN